MLWLMLSIVAVVFSPIGRAVSDRLSGRTPVKHQEREEFEWLEHRLRDRLMELEDRLELAEQRLQRPPGFAPRPATDPDETIS